MRSKGKLTAWNDDKGYGFVAPFDGGKQVFIHIRAFSGRTRRPQVNDVITFALSTDKQGRPCAARATLAGDKFAPKAARATSVPLIIIAVFFLAVVGVSVLAGSLHRLVGIAYALLSPITFATYALDKSAANRNAWRIPESSLLLLGLAGGWPGALIAQQVLRHKSKKASFLTVFWATVVINCAAFIWLNTDGGRAALESLLSLH